MFFPHLRFLANIETWNPCNSLQICSRLTIPSFPANLPLLFRPGLSGPPLPTHTVTHNTWTAFRFYSTSVVIIFVFLTFNCSPALALSSFICSERNRWIVLMCNIYCQQESTIRLEYGDTEWISIDKCVRQGCILSPHLFSLHTEHIQKAGLDSDEVGVKIGGRNIIKIFRWHHLTGRKQQWL